jgi:hypothetical protein
MSDEIKLNNNPMAEDDAVDRAVAAALRADGLAGSLVPKPDLIEINLIAARTWLRIAEALHSRERRALK